jgi:transposase InsO family protein
MTLPQAPNQSWSLDFVSDVLADGLRFRVLVLVDDFTRGCLAFVADTSLSSHRVVRELETISHPERVRSPVQTGSQPERILVMNEGIQGQRQRRHNFVTRSWWPTTWVRVGVEADP